MTSSALLRSWERFWFAPGPPHVYAALRIAFGLLGCLTLVGVSDIDQFWHIDGIVPPDSSGSAVAAQLREWDASGAPGRVLFVFTLAAFVSMTLGFQSSAAVACALLGSLLQVSWNYLPFSGADATTRNVLFCLLWADTGAAWSVDAWRRSRRGLPASVPRWIAPLRLIQFQVALIYCSSGLWKLMDPHWRDGTALQYVLTSNMYQRFPLELPASLDPLLAAATLATLLWEIAFPLLIVWSTTRRLALAIGVLIHVGILAALEIGLFSLVMLATYLAFAPEQRLAALIHRNSDRALDSVKPHSTGTARAHP